jgi:ribonuclease E
VELTRKRQGQNIYELFGRTCTTCGGLGHLVHLPGESPDAQESLEPNYRPPAAFTEPRSLPSREPAREVWERSGDDLDLDASPDLQELDLANHPSYDRGRGGDRRRRRSRIRVGEPMAREDAPPRSREPIGRNTLPKPAVVVDLDAETDGAVDEPVITAGTPLPIRNPNREGRPEKVERGGRSSGRRERPPAEPPQIVSVEMTEEEQEVYSFMGISPLILSVEPVKDPKSTIVAVALPGQSGRMPNGVTLPSELSFQESIPEDVPELPEVEAIDEPDEPDEQPEFSLSEVEAAPRYAPPVLVSSAPEPEDMTESGAEAADPRRRRRRRSSSASS